MANFAKALAYDMAVRIAYEYWAAFLKINPNREYGGETDESYKDISETPLYENFFESP